MKKAAMAAVLAAALTGCATVEVKSKLYDMKNARVLPASFLWRGDYFGPATVTLPDETCSGEYRSIQEGKLSIGTGATAGPWGAIFGTLYAGSTTERAQKGMAVALCPSGITFECEYITNVGLSGVSGHGACKDNRGDAYRLMF